MSNLPDIMKGIISNLDLSCKVLEIDLYKIYVCSTKHITVTKIVEDEAGFKYKVIGFEFDNYFELEPINHAEPFTGNLVIGPEPHFLHGTPRSVNDEYLYLKGSRTLDKTPFIWLLESYEYEDLPRDSAIEYAYTPRLFLMDWANEKKWRNVDHNDIVIKPMENLAKMIIDYIENDYSFKRVTTNRIRPRSRFGVEFTDKGNTRKIINEDLSGCELNLDLQLYDLSICNTNC